MLFYREHLKSELSRRIESNPRYSLRSFAKAIKIDAGALSLILSGKRLPSPEIADRLVRSLDLTPEEEKRFRNSIAMTHQRARKKYLRKAFRRPISSTQQTRAKETTYKELSVELFRVLADWYHYVILEMTFTSELEDDPSAIAARLGIGATEAKLAIERLKELSFLRSENGILTKTEGPLTTADKHLSTPAHRRRQRQILEKSLQSLENDPIEVRNHSAMTMAIDPELIPEAKKRISAFMRELSVFLESKSRKRVYEMQVSMFPIERGEKV
jgi:uncharacterized protein (TIGR02147 family)